MYWSGPILLAFVIYHLLHMTVGVSIRTFAKASRMKTW